MIKKTVIWVCGLVFVAALSSPACADQSIGYRHYFKEGVKAFLHHDDQKALRCFKIASIYDPSDADNNNYINILKKRGVILEVTFSKPPEESIGYKYYLSGGIKAFQAHDDAKAIRYFKIAKIFYPGSKEAGRYLSILYPRLYISNPPIQAIAQTPSQPSLPSVGPELVSARPKPMLPQPAVILQPPASIPVQVNPQVQPNLEQSRPVMPQVTGVPAIIQSQSYAPSVQPQPAPVSPPNVVYVTAQKSKQPPVILSLAQITNNGQIKPRLQIELNSSVILEGRNIQRFLIINEGFITGKIIDADHLEIDALRIGATFLHVWDDFGRHTLYVEVIFPKSINSGTSQENDGIQHSRPFVVSYGNDWDTYYSGKNIAGLKRQNYEFSQTVGVTGETPYGFFDTSGSYTDFDSISQFDYYTIGLSQIPLEGTSNFNLRAFDAERYLSPLTMPGTTIRGAFADVDLMGDLLGLSVSHGQEQVPLGFISSGETQFNDSYIDAVKLTLFPKSITDQYSFNFATGYGPDREPYLSNHVYSIQGQHAFNDFLTLSAEEGSDSSHDASLASLRWQDGAFRSGLHFRNVDKDYSTISTLPAYQGETGASWTTDADYKKFTESTFVEAYQDHLYGNPDHPSAFNYDGNGQLRVNLNDHWWSDSDFNFVDTPGELSPNSSLGADERISRGFSIWKNPYKGTVFAGVGYQNSHSSQSDATDFSREDVIAGIQLPLTIHLSTYANYEYDWLDQPASGNSNPSVINAGFEYQKQLTPKFSFTSQVDYRDELGVKPGSDGFLSGEESIIFTSGFNYAPVQDVNIFADGNASKVLSHVGDPAYDDFEVHVGMRIIFGGATYWDPLGTVSGIVFKDRNGDGRFGLGDDGIPGVKVKVGDKEVTTDKYGRYHIKIRAKGVIVTPVLDTVPGGLLFSTPQSLTVEIVQGRTSRADFGLMVQTGIYGLVFVDKNGSGIPSEGDKFVGKVKVILDGKTIEKSDSHGAFYFRKVQPGQHIISIDLNTLPLNMLPLIKLKNKIDVAEGSNYMFNIPVQIKKAEGDQD